MSTPTQPDPSAVVHQQFGLPAFFETLEKVGGIIPQTADEQDILWAMGHALLGRHYEQKQAAAQVKPGLLSKAASALGLAVDSRPQPNRGRYVAAALADATLKQAMAGYKQAAGL